MGAFRTVAFFTLAAATWAPGAVGPCFAASPTEIRQIQTDNRETLERILFECDQSYGTADLDPIRHKVELTHSRKSTNTSTQQSPPNTYASDAERVAILHWASLRRVCANRVTGFLQNAPVPDGVNPEIASWNTSFFVRGMTATGDLVAALAQGSLTFADYARKRAELVQEVDADHSRWRQAMMSADSERNVHDAEQADRQLNAFLADFTVSLRRPEAPQQRALPQPPPPPPRLYETPLAVSFRPGPDRPDDIAVIIGNGDYTKLGHDIPDVRPAHADAASIRLYVTQALGIHDKNIIALTDATGAQMLALFGSDRDYRGQLFDWVKPGRSRVFVYYAGHGAPGSDKGGPYLVPSDGEASRIGLSAYPLPLLYDNLAKLPAESVTLVLEACFSGQSQAGSLVVKASPILIASKAEIPPANVTVIAAAAGDQIASWEQDETHGLFTEYFLRGMSGEADKAPHGNGDGKVGLDELDRYLHGTLTYFARRYWGRDQTAQFARGEEK